MRFERGAVMRMIISSGWCRSCEADVMVVCQKPSYFFHFAATVLTAGLWLIPWRFRITKTKPCICCQCGRRVRLSDVTPIAETPTWSHPLAGSDRLPTGGNFNALLVARNLVYYVPTLAAYRNR